MLNPLKRYYRLVLVRHGESEWNKENRFTGWTDVQLSLKGQEEAKLGGKLLKEKGYDFDQVYTSLLRRAINTMNFILNELNQEYLPVHKHWRLNERHYGSLQGLNKAETAAKHGEDKVLVWRRSYDIPPPGLEETDQRHPLHDPRYSSLPKDALPKTECLKDCIGRVLPFWYDHIAPDILANKKVLVVAHGNSLRSLVKHLDSITDQDIINLNIPTGVPLVYELDKDLKPLKKFYLIDEKELKAKLDAVANQGKVKN
jgi:2,3-bisphosphoglycerate-dependent phosphoglycerate mutase